MNEYDKSQWLTKVSTADIHNTPYVLTDLSIARSKVAALKKLLPQVEIYYAIKSNNDSLLIQTINESIAGYDIASIGEYRQLKDMGVAAERILFSNPVKIPAHILEAYEGGVRHFAFDSMDEIEKLKRYAPESLVYVRVKVSDEGSKFPLSAKFGVLPNEVITYAQAARRVGLKVCGIAFHVGSQSENPQVWLDAFKVAGELVANLRADGFAIEFIDMGGGLPSAYEDPAPDIRAAARAINEGIAQHIPQGIRILAEPGRHISANTSVIATSVIAVERRGDANWLYLDMGVFQGLIEPLEMGFRYPIFTDYSPSASQKNYILTGPTCDAYDTLGMNYLLPADLKVGDRLYIGAAGAYTTVYGSQFNGFEVPKTYYIGE